MLHICINILKNYFEDNHLHCAIAHYSDRASTHQYNMGTLYHLLFTLTRLTEVSMYICPVDNVKGSS